MDPSESRPLIPWSCTDHLDFVKAFERYPALWDKRSQYYKNPALVNKAYEALIAKFPLYLNDANDVRKKMKSLKSGYRKDQKKALIESFTGTKRKRSEWLYIADRFFKHWGNFHTNEHDDELRSESANKRTTDSSQYLPSPPDESNSTALGQSVLSDDDFQFDPLDDHTSQTSHNSNGIPQTSALNQALNNSNFNANNSDCSVYNQVIKIEPELLEPEVSFSGSGSENFPVPHTSSSTNVNNNRRLDPCSSRDCLHYSAPQTKRKRTEIFRQPVAEEESTLSTVLERVLGEGLRSLTSKQQESSSSTLFQHHNPMVGSFSAEKGHSNDDKKHPDHYFYEFIKDLTLNWTSEQRRKLRNKFNQILEDVEAEVEAENKRNISSS